MNKSAFTRNLIALLIVLMLGAGGYIRWQFIQNPVIQGETMGTTYSITLAGRINRSDLEVIPELIKGELASVNRQMSTWLPNSEISIFNRSDEAGPYELSPDFLAVVKDALALSKSTDGAFDPTLNPLLNLWGFGSQSEERKVPTDAQIEKIKLTTGWDKLWFDTDNYLWKANPYMELNLGAIAKGHGVDSMGKLLDKAGYENWFVEIGGEVLVRGLNPDGDPWRIGIQYPSTNPMERRLQGIVHCTQGAVATSGDYRNYIKQDEKLYTHILDPRTGRTVLSDTASVTVVAPTCRKADGIATALFVMGPEKAISWVEKQDAIEALILTRAPNGKISEIISSGFNAATSYSSRN